MNDGLFRLVYLSRNEIVGDETEIRLEIAQILDIARSKNRVDSVTGALMFNANCFAQVLEGYHDGIQNTFERIQCDPRHSHVVVLSFEPVSERVFPNWSMAYVGSDSEAAKRFGEITGNPGFDPSAIQGESLIELLKTNLLTAE